MGGCRCYFRDCPVSTVRHRKMHFFHFPVKNKERFMKWVKMTGANEILKLPPSMQKNRVVCMRHFRDECFMNYKRDRLVANAVPTLMRLNRALALDYEATDEHGMPRLLTLEQTKLKHLIPPKGFVCPFELDLEEMDTELLEVIPEDSNQQVSADAKRPCLNYEVPTAKRQKLLNRTVSAVSATENSLNILSATSLDNGNSQMLLEEDSEHSVLILSEKNKDDQIEIYEIDMIESTDVNSLDDLELKHVEDFAAKTFAHKEVQVELMLQSEMLDVASQQQLQSAYTQLRDELDEEQFQHAAAAANFTNHIELLETELKIVKNQLDKCQQQVKTSLAENSELAENITMLSQANDKLQSTEKQKHFSLLNKFVTLEGQHSALQKKHIALQESYKNLEAQQQQVHTVSTSKESGSTSNSNNSNSNTVLPQTLSKAQLFNGIKKYLCSSMVSLVRMEMFGNSERQWKPDECRVAMDLLQLGEQIYKYFSDEWRFRLPALRQVRDWLNESVIVDDEEDDL